MSDLDLIDRAFESLTRDLAHAPAPGAAAAMSTARTRRRTKVGAVALATLAVVGGGLTVHGLLAGGADGVASDGGAATLDAAALETATHGWLSGWEAPTPRSTKGGGSFTMPECVHDDDVAPKEPQVSGGLSRFVGSEFALATARFATYPDPATAQAAQAEAYANCRGGTTTVDGTEVWHYSEAPADGGTSITDVWTVQIGADRLTLEVGGRAGVAPAAVVDRVAEAVVAGLRSGENQEPYDGDPNVADPDQKPQLPSVMDSDLTKALAGWKSASRATASTIPDVPCLSAQVDAGSVTASGSGTPRGVSWQIAGFDDETTGPANVARMLDEVRACTDPPVAVTTVAAGVTLVTYDAGGGDGHGALWLRALGDRAMVTGVSGAADAVSPAVADDVARGMDDWLRIPWE